MKETKEKSFKGKQELINAALKHFSDKGYVKASINDILNDARISKGTFYYHFKNKEDLYLYLIGILIEKKKEYFSNSINPQDYYKNDFFSLLKLLIKTGIKFANDNPLIYKFSERFMREKGTDIYRKALNRYNFHDNAYFEQLIDNAIEKGELRQDMPQDFIKKIIGFLFTHSVEVFNSTNMEEYEEVFDHFIKFLKDGLKKK